MKLAYKVWLEKQGNPVFGMGIYKLLTLVRDLGSLHKAAARLDMSYRAAWGKVRTFERILNMDLLERGRHGRTGAHLTEAGLVMLSYFDRIHEEMERVMTEGPVRKLLDEMNAYAKIKSRK